MISIRSLLFPHHRAAITNNLSGHKFFQLCRLIRPLCCNCSAMRLASNSANCPLPARIGAARWEREDDCESAPRSHLLDSLCCALSLQPPCHSAICCRWLLHSSWRSHLLLQQRSSSKGRHARMNRCGHERVELAQLLSARERIDTAAAAAAVEWLLRISPSR